MNESYFSHTYTEARQRFKQAASAVDAVIHSYSTDSDCQENLTIDVAMIGPDAAPTIVVSSGVHGIEGFYGSAVQLKLLEQIREANTELNTRYVLIHAVNPFGFSHLRRVNEDNVDLNRNFLTTDAECKGAPNDYIRLNHFLNPKSSPSRGELFTLKAAWNIFRHGLQPLKQALAGGQYDYPKGVFFGGRTPCQSTKIIDENCDAWIGESDHIIHIDLHTGLGPFARHKLLLTETVSSVEYSWYIATFGKTCVEPMSAPHLTSYHASGTFGDWLREHFASRKYRFVTAEFGTYNICLLYTSPSPRDRG